MTTIPLLTIDDIHAYYGNSHILQGVSFDIRPGQVIGLLGRNGVGKTTTIHTIIGLLHPLSGADSLKGPAHFKIVNL